MRLDFTKVEDVEDLRSVPEGEYACKVAEVRVSQSPAGHTRWGIRWEVTQGPFVGRTACWDSLHWTERGLPRAKFVLKILGFDVSGSLDVEANHLEGRAALVQCASEERDDPITGSRRVVNRVPFTGYKPFQGGNGQAASGPAPNGPAAKPRRKPPE